MSKPVVFVIGATGSIGSATITALAAKYADKVEIQAGVRNPDKADKLKAIAGITVVKAEMGNKDKLVNTLKGVTALFIVTPGVQNRAELTITTAEAAKQAGVKAVVVVSVTTADLADTVFGCQFGEIEGKISKLGVSYTILRLPSFAESKWSFKDTIVGQSSIYGAVDPTKHVSVIAAEDAGKAAAAILVDPTKHANKIYNLVSDRQTYNKVAEGFSKALGKEVKYIRVPYDAVKQAMLGQGIEGWQVDGLIDLFRLIDSGSPYTDIADISTLSQITGEQPTDLKAWLDKYSSGFK